MANRYANLVGSNKIKDEWTKINAGFDAVQADMDEKADADDLVNLENVVNSHIGAGGNAHAEATDQQAGFMSATDKQKLDGIESGAQVNQNAFAKVNDVEANDPSDELTITGGTGITVTTNPNTKEVIVTATGEATPGPHGSSHTEHGADPIPTATTTEGGLMSADHVQMLESHASRHAADGADPLTPEMIGAETPAGAQTKANQAEVNAKAYADGKFLPLSGGTMTGDLNIRRNAARVWFDRPSGAPFNFVGISTKDDGVEKGHVAYSYSDNSWKISTNAGATYHDIITSQLIRTGSGSPEGVIAAPPGTMYLNTAGGSGTTLYVKRTGTGNTGWFAVA